MDGHFSGWPQGGFGRLEPGSRIAGYLIEEQIGAGGMAMVFRARDETLGRLAAVKIIAPAMANDPGFHSRFLQESRAAAAIDSLHIIPVYGAGEADGLLYIATRYVAGGDLDALLRNSGGRLPPKRAVALVEQVASALNAAHATGLVHRDVKPHNILVDTVLERSEHAFLSDFGLSKATMSPAKLTMTGEFVGTPHYSSPEQIRNINVDGRTDQYALGCVAFVLLTGVLPFDRGEAMATLFAQVHDPVPTATDLLPELPAAVNDVLARALAKSPDDRYASCADFAEALRAALLPGQPDVPFVPQRRRPSDELRTTSELRGLIDASRRLFREDKEPEDLGQLLGASRRLLGDKESDLLGDKESADSGPQPEGQEPAGKHAAAERAGGRPAAGKHAAGKHAEGPPPQRQGDDTEALLAPGLSPQPPSESEPDDPNGQQKRRRRWSTFLPGTPPR